MFGISVPTIYHKPLKIQTCFDHSKNFGSEFGSPVYLTLIPVDVLFAIWSQSLDSLGCLIDISFGENILWLVLEWIFLRISEHEPVQETHQGEVGQRIAGIFDLKCYKLML